VRMFSTACDSASITLVVSKWWPFSSGSNRRNRKVGWEGDDSYVVFGQKFLADKGSVRWCIVRCLDAAAGSFVTKVWGEVFAHFDAVAIKCHSSMKNWLACQDEFFDVKQKRWTCVCSSPVSPFSGLESLDFPYTAHAFFPRMLD
jgi:hypothetical protein